MLESPASLRPQPHIPSTSAKIKTSWTDIQQPINILIIHAMLDSNCMAVMAGASTDLSHEQLLRFESLLLLVEYADVD